MQAPSKVVHKNASGEEAIETLKTWASKLPIEKWMGNTGCPSMY